MKKKNLFYKIFVINLILPILTSRRFYITEEKNKSCFFPTKCSGSNKNPFNSIASGFTMPFRNQKTFDQSFDIFLKSENYSIISNDFEPKKDRKLMADASSLKSSNINVTVMPEKCINAVKLNKTCPFYSNIQIKHENFSIFVPRYLKMQNLRFLGNDLSLNYDESLHKNCFNLSNSCCNSSSLSDKSSNCFLRNKIIPQRTRTKKGIFTFRHVAEYFSLNLIFENCVFENIHSTKPQKILFSSIILATFPKKIYDFGSKIDVFMKNCSFNASYLYRGYLDINYKDLNIQFENTSFSNYNYLEIIDLNSDQGNCFNIKKAKIIFKSSFFIKNYVNISLFSIDSFNNVSIYNSTFDSNTGTIFFMRVRNYFLCLKCRFIGFPLFNKTISVKFCDVVKSNHLKFILNIFTVNHNANNFFLNIANELIFTKSKFILKHKFNERNYFLISKENSSLAISQIIISNFSLFLKVFNPIFAKIKYAFLFKLDIAFQFYNCSLIINEKIFFNDLKIAVFSFLKRSNSTITFLFGNRIGNLKNSAHGVIQMFHFTSGHFENFYINDIEAYVGALINLRSIGQVLIANNMILDDIRGVYGSMLYSLNKSYVIIFKNIFATYVKNIWTGAITIYGDNNTLHFDNCIMINASSDQNTIIYVDKEYSRIIFKNCYFKNIKASTMSFGRILEFIFAKFTWMYFFKLYCKIKIIFIF